MPIFIYFPLSLVFLLAITKLIKGKDRYPLTILSALFLAQKPWALPLLKLPYFSSPLPLYQPQFTSPNLFTNPILESLRALVYHYFIFLSPEFIFTIIYPVSIIFIFLGIYYLASNGSSILNQFWFSLIFVSPLVGGMPLIFPLSLLSATGVLFLYKQKSLVFSGLFIALTIVFLYQAVQSFEIYFMH